ncbi:MAG: hypothetical protein ACYDHE_15220 [Candidatus Acidiferrales bacterium]
MRAISAIPRVLLKNGHRSRFVYLGALGIVGAAWVALVTDAARHYPGQRPLFLLFIVAYVLMALLALPRPRLYVYTFLAAFLFLGFCAKAVAYFALAMALVEPTGSFDGSGRDWDAALVPAIVGCASVILIRFVHLITFRRRRGAALAATAPRWYHRRRIPILVASVSGLVALNVVNLLAAFYQIGVSPRVVLPAHLNVPIEWLFVNGLAMWAATLVGWEAGLVSNRLGPALLIPLAEAVAASSTLSRAAYLFRALPYLLVVEEFPAFFRARLSGRWGALFIVLVPVGLAISLAAVSVLRITVYPLVSQVTPVTVSGATPVPSVPPTAIATVPAATPAATTGLQGGTADPRLRYVGREIGLLIIGRWIGLEGTMSVSSYPQLSLDLLSRALRENPAAGESSIYQHVSGSSYQTTDKYVFLTTPGAIGVLYYSGSSIVLFVGMALLTSLLFFFEVVASYGLANKFSVSIVAIALANAVAQMDFPYLFFVLIVEQSVAVLALSLMGRGIVRRACAYATGRSSSASESISPEGIAASASSRSHQK